jgi:hypothetical protein
MVRLGLDASQFQSGLKRAESVSAKFGSSLTGQMKGQLAALFGVGAIAAATKSVIDYAGSINDLAARLKVSTDTLQEWDYAAKMSGSSLETFVAAFQYLAKQMPGETTDNILRMFNGVAAAVKSGTISNELQYVAHMLGKSGTELIPVFKSGLAEMGDEAKKLGLVIEKDVIGKLDEFGDKMDQLGVKARSGLGNAAATFGTWLVDALDAARSSVAKMAAGVGARIGFAGAVIGGQMTAEEADKRAQAIAYEQTFLADARAAAAKYETFVRGKPTAVPIPELPADLKAKSPQESVTSTDYSWTMRKLGEANSLQQVGAFSGSTPLLVVEARTQTRILKNIERNTSDREGGE